MRIFKLAGYTIGERVDPVSAMAVDRMSKVANTDKSIGSSADFHLPNLAGRTETSLTGQLRAYKHYKHYKRSDPAGFQDT